MPEQIATAQIKALDPEVLEVDDMFPGTYGFHVVLTSDPGLEWAREFEAAYDAASYPGKPPVVFRGDTLCVFYLPRYADDLPGFLRFLKRTVGETNRAVEQRNAVLPDEAAQKETFRQRLRDLAGMVAR